MFSSHDPGSHRSPRRPRQQPQEHLVLDPDQPADGGHRRQRSGKSSLAFDTIYAEGQRRYVESLSAYARQFLERMDKPDVDEVRGIAPAIAIRQKNSTRNPRSTVGTQTEIYDYLRLLYARVGTTICRVCGREVHRDSPESAADEALARTACRRHAVLCPLSRRRGIAG